MNKIAISKGLSLSIGALLAALGTGLAQWNNAENPPLWPLIGMICGACASGCAAWAAFVSRPESPNTQTTENQQRKET